MFRVIRTDYHAGRIFIPHRPFASKLHVGTVTGNSHMLQSTVRCCSYVVDAIQSSKRNDLGECIYRVKENVRPLSWIWIYNTLHCCKMMFAHFNIQRRYTVTFHWCLWYLTLPTSPINTNSFIHSVIQTISIAPLQVHFYSEAFPTQHGYCVGVSHRSATGNCELRTCPRSLRGG